MATDTSRKVIIKRAENELTQAFRLARYEQALHDIAHASNHDELMKAILKHKDVLRECM